MYCLATPRLFFGRPSPRPLDGGPVGCTRLHVVLLPRSSRRCRGYFNDRADFADDVPILPQRLIGELQRGSPEKRLIVTCDAGENRIMMTHFYQTKRAEGFLQAAGSGPMGFRNLGCTGC